jgi:hypothetical protein
MSSSEHKFAYDSDFAGTIQIELDNFWTNNTINTYMHGQANRIHIRKDAFLCLYLYFGRVSIYILYNYIFI